MTLRLPASTPPAALFFTVLPPGATSMPNPVIGLSKHKFKINHDNTFRVYGENFDTAGGTLNASFQSSSFDWDPPDYEVTAANRKPHFVVLTSKPKPNGALAPTTKGAPGFAGDTDDDLTITL